MSETGGALWGPDGAGGTGDGGSERMSPDPRSSPEEDGSSLPDRVDFDPDYDPDDPVWCEVCGAEMYYTAACKLKCPRCGYARDCSDP